MTDLGILSAVFDDLSRMVLADNVESNPYDMELIGALREFGIELCSSPDQAAVDAIAEWAVLEGREDVADVLRSDMEEVILEATTRKRKSNCDNMTRQTSEGESDKSDNEDIVGSVRSPEDKIFHLRIAEEELAVEGDHRLSRHLREFSNSLLSCTTAQESVGTFANDDRPHGM